MLNTSPLNRVKLNDQLVAFTTAASQDDIVFNTYSLQNSGIVTQVLLQDNTPERDIDSFNIPRDDGRSYVGDYWRRKTISIRGVVSKDTNSILESTLDDMKRYLGVPNSELDIKIDGTIRRYIATLSNGDRMFARRRGYHVTTCPFDLQFTCLEPFGKSTEYEATTYFDKTDLSFTENVINSGTVTGKPYLAINITAASAITEISFTNNTTEETITITRSFSAGEYLAIDCEEKTVKVNGVAVDYDGIFPDIAIGTNSYSVDFTGTSATYTLTMKTLPKYL